MDDGSNLPGDSGQKNDKSMLVECKLGDILQIKNERTGRTTYKELSREQAEKSPTPEGECHCVTCKSRRAFSGDSPPS